MLKSFFLIISFLICTVLKPHYFSVIFPSLSKRKVSFFRIMVENEGCKLIVTNLWYDTYRNSSCFWYARQLLVSNIFHAKCFSDSREKQDIHRQRQAGRTRNEARLKRNRMKGGNLYLSSTVCMRLRSKHYRWMFFQEEENMITAWNHVYHVYILRISCKFTVQLMQVQWCYTSN